ncbi:16S rRNA (guanine(527)-N(7))-methyltransferase RsmG [Oscillospiraceae bacterium CM]|nr:16S rRNA (guanine(527)-N(7))-methyltransferase RsmG [Oscillospiraceae bacterium CM]
MKSLLIQGAKALGIELTDEMAAQLSLYAAFLEEKNSVMNLTAISGVDDIARFHFLDSLALLPTASFQGCSVIDVGTGPGFPGVPLKIAEPTIKLTLLDSQQKRVNFLKELCTQLKLTGVVCLNARAEEAARTAALRGMFDIAVSRAVARLNVLAELCLPFVKTGGLFMAMKAVDSDAEISEAANAFEKLGAVLEAVKDYEIQGAGIMHRAVCIRKTTATPEAYPRRFAKIQKSPL